MKKTPLLFLFFLQFLVVFAKKESQNQFIKGKTLDEINQQELPIASLELETVKTDRGISASSTQLMNALDFELRPRNSAQDISGRFNFNAHFIADFDVNLSRSIFVEKYFAKRLASDYYVPLAPRLTSSGGLTYRQKAVEMSLRYRHLAARPANEDGSVMARAYTILDLNAAYTFHNNRFAISIENLLNQQWNEAQFDTASRLISENAPVSEIHFTPGTPVALKLIYTRSF